MFSVMDIDPINSLKIIFRWIRKDNFCSQFGLEMHFSNSLIIHKEKTKEITTVTVVWIPDLN